MPSMNPEVDDYFARGCGRCSLAGTPQCKVHNWTETFRLLRTILLESGLTETRKWEVACYTFENKNVVLMSAFKEYGALAFFKGSLMKDPKGLLVSPGDNSQAVRQIRFTDAAQVAKLETTVKAYLKEAIALEKSGAKVDFNAKSALEFPAELQQKMAENSAFKSAFEALTPGRKRGYILHFTTPKQSATRTARIEKCTAKIFDGKGLNDR